MSELSQLPDAGDFMALRDGVCHYRMDGPRDGTVVVLIHGATVPAWEFDRMIPLLTAAGLRTVRADLFGHGYSDRPRVSYDHALFVRQISELIDALGISQKMHLFGHSLGAAIGTRLLCHQPDRFASLVLAAPLVNFTVNAPSTRLLDLPLLGELLMPIYVLPMLVRRRTRRYGPIEDGRFVHKFQTQLIRPGFGRALLSLFRSGALGDQSDCYRALSRHQHPVLLLRGAEDPIVSPHQIETIRTLVARARYQSVADTAHSFILTDPEKVAPLVIDFIATHAARRDSTARL